MSRPLYSETGHKGGPGFVPTALLRDRRQGRVGLCPDRFTPKQATREGRALSRPLSRTFRNCLHKQTASGGLSPRSPFDGFLRPRRSLVRCSATEALLDACADETADESAYERRADLAPVLGVEGAVVVVVLRPMVPGGGLRRTDMVRVPVPRFGLDEMDVCGRLRRGLRRGVRRNGRLRRRLGCVLLDRLCLRYCRRLSGGMVSAPGCGVRGSANGGANRQRQHQCLECLVHCRVPFCLRASPFSRLHHVRGAWHLLLTKHF